MRLLALEERGELTSAQARTVLKVLVADGGDPVAIAADLGFQAMAPDALEDVVDRLSPQTSASGSAMQAVTTS